MPDLSSFPKLPFSIGLAGIFDQSLSLDHVIAWHIHWLEMGVYDYQKELVEWLGLKSRFLSHVTLPRKPCDEEKWKSSFRPLPLFVKNINLYESLGFSKYKVLWQYPLHAPFEEIEHTADIAFIVRGDLFLHAQLALAFYFPPMLRYYDSRKITDFDAIVAALNAILAKVDGEIGCLFKAISFHGTEKPTEEWEMIVDV